MREDKPSSASLSSASRALPQNPAAGLAADWIKSQMVAVGFDLVGLTQAGPIRHPQAFHDYLARGWQGEMHWLERHLSSRLDSSQLFPGAKTAVVGACNYWQPEPQLLTREQSAALVDHTLGIGEQTAPTAAPLGRMARYAWSRDYHVTLKKKLFRVADRIQERWPGSHTQVCVDTAPIHERDLAARAGLGWIGKHTLLLNPRRGSWLLLGVILTDLDLPADTPMRDHCGTCTACLNACPTGALDPRRPYTLEARKCISYTTIELRRSQESEDRSQQTDFNQRSQIKYQNSPLPEVTAEVAGRTGDWLFGCDICQEVCPYNRKSLPAQDPDMAVRVQATRLPLKEVLDWTEADRQAYLAGTAVKRASLEQLKRNARVCLSGADSLPAEHA